MAAVKPAPTCATTAARDVTRAADRQADASRAAWLRQARSHLRAVDPVVARLIDDQPDFDPQAWITQLPAIESAYQLGHLPAKDEVLAIADKWRPHRSLATSYLISAAFGPAETSLSSRDGYQAL